jgi:hypothetical protein
MIPAIPVKEIDAFLDHIRLTVAINKSSSGAVTVCAETGIQVLLQVVFSE